MRRLLLPVLLGISTLALAGEQADAVKPTLEYKGVRFGATQAALLEAHPDFRCSRDTDHPEDSSCMLLPRCSYLSYSSRTACEREFADRHTYAGEPTTMVMASFHQDRLISVGIKILPRSYERIRDALATKYGAADESTEVVTTNAGVSHDNHRARWDTPDGTIRMRRLAGRVDEGMVTLMSKEWLALTQARKKDKARSAPGDL